MPVLDGWKQENQFFWLVVVVGGVYTRGGFRFREISTKLRLCCFFVCWLQAFTRGEGLRFREIATKLRLGCLFGDH